MSDTPTPLPPADPAPRRYLSDPQFIMGLAVLAVSFGVLALYALGIAKDGDVKTAAVSFITLILGYFYGSSRGSADKTDTLNSIVKKQ
jgi:4-hydroxybenzoate polyprenyltransferase